ncbi:MAG: hypothetical protein AAFX53_11535 [Bacteroidota bacterium]
MKRDVRRGFGICCMLLWTGLMLIGCASPRAKFKREYRKIWKEIVNSEAWRNSLLAESNPRPGIRTDFYSPVLDERNLSGKKYVTLLEEEAAFRKKYDALVHRAYFKIIAEAEKADERLRKEYLDWNRRKSETENTEDDGFHEELALINKRYTAHRKMLKGLKSWNIQSEYRSDDLRFFKNEHRAEVQRMFNTGEDEGAIVRFLIFELADLYHFKE